MRSFLYEADLSRTSPIFYYSHGNQMINEGGLRLIVLNKAKKPKRLLYVPQKYAGFRYNYQGKGTSSIGTFGVGPCIGFVLHESGTNSGMVAHFDSDATGPVHNALIVAQDLYSEFKKHAGDKVQTYIVIGSGPDISTDTIARTLYTVCENNGMDPILTKADSGDFFLSLKTGKLFALNIWGGPTPDKQFTKYMDKISLKPENYKICRLQVPIKQASVYQAP